MIVVVLVFPKTIWFEIFEKVQFPEECSSETLDVPAGESVTIKSVPEKFKKPAPAVTVELFSWISMAPLPPDTVAHAQVVPFQRRTWLATQDVSRESPALLVRPPPEARVTAEPATLLADVI